MSKISDAFNKVETLSLAEIEALMSITNETTHPSMHVGATCKNKKDQLFTVIGFSEKTWTQLKSNPHEYAIDYVFDPKGTKKNILGLFFDAELPER
jgi:hypothetical protein